LYAANQGALLAQTKLRNKKITVPLQTVRGTLQLRAPFAGASTAGKLT